MMEVEEKKYIPMENILNKIIQQHITLPENEKQRNNMILRPLIDELCTKMKSDKLFNKLYQDIFYGGSYFENLKISNPSEYDIDCVLSLPKIIEPVVEVSSKPGFVHVLVKSLEKMDKRPEAPDYEGLNKLLTKANYLSTENVIEWAFKLLKEVLDSYPKKIKKEDDLCKETYCITIPTEKGEANIYVNEVKINGPALTLLLDGELTDEKFYLDVDFVMAFKFFESHWPNGYRKGPNLKKDSYFLIVPKSPMDVGKADKFWRLSFQEQEKELINGTQALKPTIKILKKLRDNYNHEDIASYFIKTIFLWELEKQDKNWWSKPKGYILVVMLKKYEEYLSKGKIPYYWNKKNNLLAYVEQEKLNEIAACIEKIVNDIEENVEHDPFTFAKHLLNPCDVQTLRNDVDVGKRHQKNLEKSKLTVDIAEEFNNKLQLETNKSINENSELKDFSNEKVYQKLTSIENKLEELKSNINEMKIENKTIRDQNITIIKLLIEKTDILTDKVNGLE